MEKSVTWQFDTLLRETFQLPEGKPGEYSPLVLAYLGDAIYDLIIRTLVVGGRQPAGEEAAQGYQRSCAGFCSVPDDGGHRRASHRGRGRGLPKRQERQKLFHCQESVS